MENALEVVDFMVRHLDKNDIPGGVKCMMLALRMPEDLLGYNTAILATLAFYENPEQMMTKDLYADLGKQLGVSRFKVEKDIRQVIQKAWKQRDPEVWNLYFPEKKMPSNRKFIARLAQILDVWQICSHASSSKEQEETKAK